MAKISLVPGGRVINQGSGSERRETFDKSTGTYRPAGQVLGAATSAYPDTGSTPTVFAPEASGPAPQGGSAGDAGLFAGVAEGIRSGRITTGSLTGNDLAAAISRQGALVSAANKGKGKGKTTTDTSAASLLGTSSTGVSETSVAESGRRSQRTGITDKEVLMLEGQGFLEGDFVPGRGVLRPDGTFDDSAFAELDLIEQQALAIQKQIKELEEQDNTAATGAIVSDTPIVKAEEAALEALNQPDSVISGALQLLEKQEQILQDQLTAEIQSVNNAANAQKAALADEQAGEAGTLSVGLASAGGYLGFSGSGTGVMLSLTKAHRAEMQDLELQRQQAISRARSASADRQMDIVRDMAREVSRLEEQAYKRQRDYNAEIKKAAEKQKAEAAAQQTQVEIFNAIQNGAQSPEDIFSALGGRVDINEIDNFLGKIGQASEEGFSFTPSNTAKLLGAGMSQDDVKALNEYVNENGYDETVREALSPMQRMAADKIFREAPKVGGGEKNIFDFTDQEWRKLRQAGLMEAPWQDQANFLYGDTGGDTEFESIYTSQIIDGRTTIDALPLDVQEDAREELLELGFGSDVVPSWYRDFVEAENQQTPDAEVLKSKWQSYRKRALGEEVDTEDNVAWWQVWK